MPCLYKRYQLHLIEGMKNYCEDRFQARLVVAVDLIYKHAS